MKVDGLSREDVLCRSMWNVGIDLIATRLRCIRQASLIGDIGRCDTLISLIVVGLFRYWPQHISSHTLYALCWSIAYTVQMIT